MAKTRARNLHATAIASGAFRHKIVNRSYRITYEILGNTI